MSKGKITRIDAIKYCLILMKQRSISYAEAAAELNRDFDIVFAQASQPVVRVKGIADWEPAKVHIGVDTGALGSDQSVYSIMSEDGYILGTALTKEEVVAIANAMSDTKRYKGNLDGETFDDSAEEISRFDLIDI